MLYFAYGSNMARKRLEARIISARVVTVARLNHHRLAFHKRGRDGTGKCDIVATGRSTDEVYGVVYHIQRPSKTILDGYEGLGCGYEEKHCSVSCSHGVRYKVFTYYATDIDTSLKPFDWYKSHVICGALEHDLPPHYLKQLQKIECVYDDDHARRSRELGIHSINPEN